MSDYIPQELILQILTRLPPKSLLRFRCVSKSWCYLISSPNFIAMHTRQLTLSNHFTNNTRTLIRRYNLTQRKELYSVHFDTNQLFNIDHDAQIEFLFSGFVRSYFRIVGSCNGLLCISDDLFGNKDTIILWNPTIRRKLNLPIPRATLESSEENVGVLGFGFDCNANDYKVVRLAYVQRGDWYKVPPLVEVYTVKEGEWRGVSAPAPAPRYCIAEHFWSQAFVSGKVHWIAFQRSGGRGSMVSCLVLWFDLGNEVFGQMMLPESLVRESPMNMALGVVGESLAVFQSNRCMSGRCCSIWMMREYGVVESWSRLFNTDLDRHLGIPLGVRKNGEVLMAARSGELISHKTRTEGSRNLGIFGTKSSFYVDSYCESLVLLLEGKEVKGTDTSDSESDSSEEYEEEEEEEGEVQSREHFVELAMIQFLTALLSEF
ncbi:hypothetical protein RJ639_004458 [Escallonia herrerae]|uniref:F-box domain-containing protein n=1 Tax=Escallonia herrerae TaxID=1293975 RepID=A0AA88W4I8_9ASTE|nr:hypothetical protein RJ639_004458 [Escallonia herrerae]